MYALNFNLVVNNDKIHNGDKMNGIILVNKEKDMSSHDVVSKLRRIYQTKKIGHCGTLDPAATGVLVCLVNQATKIANNIVLDTKEYYATFRLGQATTTQDLEGEVVAEKPYQNDLSREAIVKILNGFVGVQNQQPSIYSAIKVNGKKLYEYARHNEDVDIPIREIEIFDIELVDVVDDLITIKVNCSSGTYIRTLCYDIAQKLGYPGVLVKLHRSRSGIFEDQATYTLTQLSENKEALIAIKDALPRFKRVILDNEQINDVKNGKTLQIEQDDDFIVLDQNEQEIALYHRSDGGVAKMMRGLW